MKKISSAILITYCHFWFIHLNFAAHLQMLQYMKLWSCYWMTLLHNPAAWIEWFILIFKKIQFYIACWSTLDVLNLHCYCYWLRAAAFVASEQQPYPTTPPSRRLWCKFFLFLMGNWCTLVDSCMLILKVLTTALLLTWNEFSM